MKSCSSAYILLVTAAIPVLFTISELLYGALSFGDTTDVISIVGHGLSIVLFFHLITKCLGLPFGWRVAVGAISPTLLYALYYWQIHDQITGSVVFSVRDMLVFYSIKFLICSAIAEYAMQELEKRVTWLSCKQGGG